MPLTGSISPEIGNLTGLTILWLEANQLTGSIPPEIGNLTNLNRLRLGDNEITGEIPPEIWDLTDLVILDLSGNQHTGSIPPEIGNLTQLRELRLRDNRLSGTIPSEIGDLVQLTNLALYSNQLSGAIPVEITNLVNIITGRSTLMLNWNMLHSEDPVVQSYLDVQAPGWEGTQTVPPTDVTVQSITGISAIVSWTPILYRACNGGYTVHYGIISGGPYPYATEETEDKDATSLTVTGLEVDTEYYFVVTSHTVPCPDNWKNDLVSTWSEEVSARTLANDSDGDGVLDEEDNCPPESCAEPLDCANPDQADDDGDRWGNVCDNCPDEMNADRADEDTDGV
jgi:hypothetical protein